METSQRIVVTGATGYTGRLVAWELAESSAPFVLTGRSADRLAELAHEIGGADTQTVNVKDPASLQRLLRRGDVVINCAGPFTELGEPVVGACIAAGAHYLDITGEQGFMKRIAERYHEPAERAGVVVTNAMAWEYALGDSAAAIAARGLTAPLRSVHVTYAIRGGSATSSRGTRRSVLKVLGRRGYTFRDGEWRPVRTAARRRKIRLPDGGVRAAVSFPAGEVLMVPRHQAVREVHGWMVVGRATASFASLFSPVLPYLVRAASPLVELLVRRGPDGPTAEQRTASTFTILAEATGASNSRRYVAVRGRDPYGLTAAIVVQGALALLRNDQEKRGVLAPSELIEPVHFFDSLADHGLTWEEGEPA